MTKNRSTFRSLRLADRLFSTGSPGASTRLPSEPMQSNFHPPRSSLRRRDNWAHDIRAALTYRDVCERKRIESSRTTTIGKRRGDDGLE